MLVPRSEKNFAQLKHERYLGTVGFDYCANTPNLDGGEGDKETRGQGDKGIILNSKF